MRRDMQKLLTERERYGSSSPNRKAGKRLRSVDEGDDEPTRLSRKALYGGRTKSFTDVLSPLRRYLRANVGRPWNKVYSEIREHLDERSITGRHLFEHLRWEVTLDGVEGDDGKVYHATRWPWGDDRVRGLYVHPRTGLLCWTPPLSARERREWAAPAEATRVPVTETSSYVRIAGIWYYAEYEVVPPPRGRVPVGPPEWVWYQDGPRWMHLLRKRQCGAKELRARALVNTPAVP